MHEDQNTKRDSILNIAQFIYLGELTVPSLEMKNFTISNTILPCLEAVMDIPPNNSVFLFPMIFMNFYD